uniref:F-box domain-containing protein n=1 Tax=Panagrolaimus sp. ES5 TaxID=591445 RepID=A0AC34GTZ7_9BILA
MDVKILQRALPSSKFAPDPNAEYTFKNPRRQLFDLPYSIMKNVIKNANGAVWKKLIQTCKYFYAKKDLYPVEKFMAYVETHKLPASAVIPKIYKFDLRVLQLCYQNLTLEEYQILTVSGTVENLNLKDVIITQSHGFPITLDMLFENLRNLQEFELYFRDIRQLGPDTAQKMTVILPRLQKLRKLKLIGVNQNFDLFSFTDFLMKNETVFIHLIISSVNSDAFVTMINRIIETPPKRIPFINYLQFEDYPVLCQRYHKLYVSRNFVL